MPNTIISPDMGLPIPVVGVDVGPDWATNINACLTAIDSHNHTAGLGVPITCAAINVNADLPLNNNNLITARTIRFQPQVSAPAGASDFGCLTEIGVDLYYIDGAGNPAIRITQGGSIVGAAGTITGLPSGTASASFAAGTFTFQSATNTPAAMNQGPTTIGQAVASGFGVTLQANGSQASNYALTFPTALPASQKIMSLDNTGQIAATYVVDNTTIEISSSTIQVKDGGISYAKLAALNFVQSSSSGSVTTTSNSFVDVTNQSVTITTTGRPVAISFTGASIGSSTSDRVEFKVLRGVTELVTNTIGSDGANVLYPPGSLNLIDYFPPAGSNTYKLQYRSVNGVTTAVVNSVVTSVYEI